ncbi:MAG: DUF4160 domain-containing protein [Gemmatimonadales bacterium]
MPRAPWVSYLLLQPLFQKPNASVIITVPPVLRFGAYRFIIYSPPRDHGPPHVHAVRAGREAVITLAPVSLRSVAGMRDVDVVTAVHVVERFRSVLLERWKRIHGEETAHDR